MQPQPPPFKCRRARHPPASTHLRQVLQRGQRRRGDGGRALSHGPQAAHRVRHSGGAVQAGHAGGRRQRRRRRLCRGGRVGWGGLVAAQRLHNCGRALLHGSGRRDGRGGSAGRGGSRRRRGVRCCLAGCCRRRLGGRFCGAAADSRDHKVLRGGWAAMRGFVKLQGERRKSPAAGAMTGDVGAMTGDGGGPYLWRVRLIQPSLGRWAVRSGAGGRGRLGSGPRLCGRNGEGKRSDLTHAADSVQSAWLTGGRGAGRMRTVGEGACFEARRIERLMRVSPWRVMSAGSAPTCTVMAFLIVSGIEMASMHAPGQPVERWRRGDDTGKRHGGSGARRRQQTPVEGSLLGQSLDHQCACALGHRYPCCHPYSPAGAQPCQEGKALPPPLPPPGQPGAAAAHLGPGRLRTLAGNRS